jgi:hypothetical protein
MISFLLSCLLGLVNSQEYENIIIICILQIFASGIVFYNNNLLFFYVFEVLYNLFQFFRCSFVEIKYERYSKEVSKRFHRNIDYINFVSEGNFDKLLKITYQYKTCNQNIFENNKVLKNLKVDEFIIKNNNDVFQDFKVFRYPNRINFKTQVVRMQGMLYVPKFMKYLSCKKFDMSLNFIEKLENLPYNVEEINANYNSIREIKLYSKRLRKLSLKSNNLRSFKLMNKKLVSLDLSHNLLNHIDIDSERLKYLKLSGNNFENPPAIKRLDLLKYLNVSHNNFVVIPEWFTEVPTLNVMYNPIMLDLNSEVCQTYLREYYPFHFTNENRHRTIYEDSQNIHNHTLHESLLKCLEEIEEIYEDKKKEIEEINYKEEIKKNMITTSYQQMNHMCETTQNYGNLNINFPKALKTIWYLVRDRENRDDILRIMETEFLDSKEMCYTGFIGRLVNSIMGMNILKSSLEISKTDQIIGRYIYVKNKIEKESGEIGEDLDKIKLLRDYFIEELQELGLDEPDIEKWTKPLTP